MQKLLMFMYHLTPDQAAARVPLFQFWLTRKQKEALSAQGWDSRLYLCVRDAPDHMVLLNRTTGKTVMFHK